jgi:glycosidase
MRAQAALFEHPEKLIASLDNYEEDSFLSKVEGGNGARKLFLASAFLLTLPRVPFLYSGNEFGIDYRQPGALFQGHLDAEYYRRFKQLIRIRRENPVFRRGTLDWMEVTPTLLSYRRAYQGQNYLVALNNAAKPQTMTLDLGHWGITGSRIDNLLLSKDPHLCLVTSVPGDISLVITLEPWEAKILRCR